MLPVLRKGKGYSGDPFTIAPTDFNSMLDRMFNHEWWSSGTAAYPANIWEDEDNLFVEAELPGFSKEEIDITVENGVLSIVGEHKETEESKGQWHLNERRYSKYYRHFTLPTMVAEDGVEAKLTDGVLHLKLPKREEVKPRRIEVK